MQQLMIRCRRPAVTDSLADLDYGSVTNRH